jgi:hypothetical protein
MACNIGCPSCFSTDHIKIRGEGDHNNKLITYNDEYHVEEIIPCVCLHCGTVYIDKKTLNLLNSKVKNNGIS